MELNSIIFSLILLLFSYFLSKYSLLILNKSNRNFLIDNQFDKPQAFHDKPTYRLGGLTIFLSLALLFFYSYTHLTIFYIELISFCTLFFILGFVDDLKINIKPKFRLILMIILLLALVIYNEFKIERISLEYLDHLMKIDIFAIFFVSFCFLFIINGSNLIDGFNGLLGLHSLIIFVVLMFINFSNENYDLAYILFNIGLITIIFISFNFPYSQMFLGDGGAYLLGTLISVSSIMTNNLYPAISSFFFCILLFYLFFEVFFSFFRKIFFVHQNPLLPDNKHLHMLLYKFLLKKSKKKLKTNYKVSVYINLIYLLLITPAIFFMDNGQFCRIYFFFLLIIYTYFYRKLYFAVK